MTSMGKALFWKDKPLCQSGCCRVGAPSGWRRSRSAPALDADLMFPPPEAALGERIAGDRARARAAASGARSARRSAAGRSCRAGRGSNNAARPCRPPLCATLTLRPSMSPSWRSSAARSASTARAHCGRGAADVAPGPGPASALGRCSAWRTDRPLATIPWPAPRVGRRRDGPRMAHADIASQQRLAHEFRKIEQSQQVGDVAARLADQLADIVLGVAKRSISWR
jgi:hypothetical protein